jgi:hypothetical protein
MAMKDHPTGGLFLFRNHKIISLRLTFGFSEGNSVYRHRAIPLNLHQKIQVSSSALGSEEEQK